MSNVRNLYVSIIESIRNFFFNSTNNYNTVCKNTRRVMLTRSFVFGKLSRRFDVIQTRAYRAGTFEFWTYSEKKMIHSICSHDVVIIICQHYDNSLRRVKMGPSNIAYVFIRFTDNIVRVKSKRLFNFSLIFSNKYPSTVYQVKVKTRVCSLMMGKKTC